jgi:N6-L-threonylcarbamoyladenine synthase
LSVILAIETSCDETAIALFRGPAELLASTVASQIDLHRPYGGVVPELASRNHLVKVQPVLESALTDSGVELSAVKAVAATRGPGLLTALLVGYALGKGLAIGLACPFIGVNHLEGHLWSPFFGRIRPDRPWVGLVVSGGHTLLVLVRGLGDYELLGSTVDDAAGEAFDKVANLLGLGYPGGPMIEQTALGGDPERFRLPRALWQRGDYNFSFSGLKTAVRYLLPKLSGDYLADLCASFQEAIIDVLVWKTIEAARASGAKQIAVSGGVSCNQRLRAKMLAAAESAGFDLRLAPTMLTTDNAAMIAFAGYLRWVAGQFSQLNEDADPNLRLV